MKADITKTITLVIETQDIRIINYIVLLAEQKLEEMKKKISDPAIKIYGNDIVMVKDLDDYICELKAMLNYKH